MKLTFNSEKYFTKIYFLLAILLFSTMTVKAQTTSLYVGQSQLLVCPNPPVGAIYQTAWASRNSSVSVVKKSDYSVEVTVKSYFSGTAQVQCDYYWRWYSGNRQLTNHATTYFNITCKPVDIRMNQTGPIHLNSGSGTYLSVTLSPSISPTPTVNWRSSNNNIAEVSQNGYVMAKAPGTATITASTNAGPNSASITIDVNAVSVTRAEISPTIAQIVLGETVDLKSTYYPQYSQPSSVSWVSTDPSVASVSSSGRVTGRSLGQSQIYCVVNGSIYSNRSTITVNKPKLTISADKPSGLYEKNTEVSLSASRSGATIYYTLDGSDPTYRSNVYTTPIVLERSTTLKAFASKTDCLDSDMLEKEYEISSLAVESTLPKTGEKIFRKNFTPTLFFSDSIFFIEGGKNISLYRGWTRIDGEPIITASALSFVPNENLKEGEYTLSVPARSLLTSNGETNFSIDFPFYVGSDNSIIDFACGYKNTFVVKGDNTLWVTGYDTYGELGIGGGHGVTPQKVMDDIISVEASECSSAAITNKHELYLWGYNEYGQVGNGSTNNQYRPQSIASNISKVVSSGCHTLALSGEGTLLAWGENYTGQLGLGIKGTYKWEPWGVMSNVSDIAAGDGFSLIVTETNNLYSCGVGSSGQLGNGSTTSTSKPTFVMSGVQKIAALKNASIILKTDGSLWAVGSNEYGQLGIGDSLKNSLDPIKIMEDVKDIDAFNLVGMAIKNDNSLWGWGWNNYGQLATGSRENKKYPITKILDSVNKVSVGSSHVMALMLNGRLMGWGNNFHQCMFSSSLNYYLEPTESDFYTASTPPTSLTIPALSIRKDESGIIIPRVYPDTASYSGIEWNTSDPEILSISEFGKVTGLKSGKADITCKIWLNGGDTIVARSSVNVISDETTITSLFLTGNFNSWTFDDNYKLDLQHSLDADLYEGTIKLPAGYSAFKICSLFFNYVLGAKYNNSKQIYYDPLPESTRSHTVILTEGGENLIIPESFPGGEIKVTLVIDRVRNIYAITFSFDNISGIETNLEDVIEDDAIYYNLYGIRVEKPTHGIYIRVHKGIRKKVIIR